MNLIMTMKKILSTYKYCLQRYERTKQPLLSFLLNVKGEDVMRNTNIKAFAVGLLVTGVKIIADKKYKEGFEQGLLAARKQQAENELKEKNLW